MDALTSSNSFRAVVIFLFSWRSSLDRQVNTFSEVARGHSMMREVLSASGVLDPVSWIDRVELGEWLDGVAWGEVCGRVTTEWGYWVLFSQTRENSLFPCWGGAPRAADGVCVLEVMYCGGEWGAVGKPVVVVQCCPEIQPKWVFCSGWGGSHVYNIA